MRFAFLQSGMTGYNDASLRALSELGHNLLNVYPKSSHNYAFDSDAFTSYGEKLTWSDKPDQAELDAAIDSFRPDVIVMVSWHQPEYRKVVRRMRGKALRILVSTNVWENRPRQWLGRLTHRWYIDPLFDCVFVPGERSEWFARRLGFEGDQIIRGSNSADVATFDKGQRSWDKFSDARRFLFTGRLMPYKGVDTLATAYATYRQSVADPWDLEVVGLGELSAQLQHMPGVTMHGFVTPSELSSLMQRSTCLVLPSMVDFFGVVVHEAALSGMVLLCSDGVGATPYLLQDGFNGWTLPAGDARRLSDALKRVTELPADRLMKMSIGSRSLATRFSPQLWAANLADEAYGRLAREGCET